MITKLDAPVAVSRAESMVAPIHLFDACMGAKNRMLRVLGAIFFVYYLALIVGAGWFRPLYTTSLPGGLNLGIVFALSQYVLGAVLALVYARRMKRIDAQISAFAETRKVKHAIC